MFGFPLSKGSILDHARRATKSRARPRRLHLEALESRCCLTTVAVTTLTQIPLPAGVKVGDTVQVFATQTTTDYQESSETPEPLIILTPSATYRPTTDPSTGLVVYNRPGSATFIPRASLTETFPLPA